jgi:penicillin-binding protein 2
MGTRDADGNLKRLPAVEEKPVTGIAAVDWDTVIDAMTAVTHCGVYCGTGSAAFAKAAYNAAGKTGTAQVYTVAQNAKYNAKTVSDKLRDHAWFIAFAPVESPRIAVAVLAENAGFGAGTAGPIARQVLDAYLLGDDGKLKPSMEPGAKPSELPSIKAPETPAQPAVPVPDQKQAETPPPPAPIQAHKQS